MSNRRPTRSDSYQWSIVEIMITQEHMESFNNSQGYQHILNPWHYNEEVLELQDKLSEKLWNVIDGYCTQKQKTVLKMFYKDGMTQMEIAKATNCNQSSITKSLNGNQDMNFDKRYGGSYKKLRDILSKDKEFMGLLARIIELQEEKF